MTEELRMTVPQTQHQDPVTRLEAKLDELKAEVSQISKWFTGYMNDQNQYVPGFIQQIEDLRRRVSELEKSRGWVVQVVAHIATAVLTAVISGWAVMTILGGKHP